MDDNCLFESNFYARISGNTECTTMSLLVYLSLPVNLERENVYNREDNGMASVISRSEADIESMDNCKDEII